MRNFKYLVALVLWAYLAFTSIVTSVRIITRLVLDNRKQISFKN